MTAVFSFDDRIKAVRERLHELDDDDKIIFVKTFGEDNE